MERLIPPEWFVDMHWTLLLVIAAAATYGLMTGADWLVHAASRLARRVGVPKVVVGATIVSLGTTSPECAVSVVAAWHGRAGLALGNAVGSIVADSGLIFGLGCLMAVLPADRFLLTRQGWVQFGAAVLLATLCYVSYALFGPQAVLGRGVGVLFLLLLSVYLAMSVRWSRQRLSTSGDKAAKTSGSEDDPSAIPPVAVPGPEDLQLEVVQPDEERPLQNSAVWLLTLIGVGVAVVVLTSHVLIVSVSELARQFGVPHVVIAATMVALGTSMPELVVGLSAVRHGHPELLVGNVIGADVLNVLFVVGASAVAAPLPILDPGARLPAIFLIVHLPTMLAVLVLFRLYIWKACRQGHFQRWMGLPLLVMYCLYVVIQYALG